jgi:hypothetical protein
MRKGVSSHVSVTGGALFTAAIQSVVPLLPTSVITEKTLPNGHMLTAGELIVADGSVVVCPISDSVSAVKTALSATTITSYDLSSRLMKRDSWDML